MIRSTASGRRSGGMFIDRVRKDGSVAPVGAKCRSFRPINGLAVTANGRIYKHFVPTELSLETSDSQESLAGRWYRLCDCHSGGLTNAGESETYENYH